MECAWCQTQEGELGKWARGSGNCAKCDVYDAVKARRDAELRAKVPADIEVTLPDGQVLAADKVRTHLCCSKLIDHFTFVHLSTNILHPFAGYVDFSLPTRWKLTIAIKHYWRLVTW